MQRKYFREIVIDIEKFSGKSGKMLRILGKTVSWESLEEKTAGYWEKFWKFLGKLWFLRIIGKIVDITSGLLRQILRTFSVELKLTISLHGDREIFERIRP